MLTVLFSHSGSRTGVWPYTSIVETEMTHAARFALVHLLAKPGVRHHQGDSEYAGQRLHLSNRVRRALPFPRILPNGYRGNRMTEREPMHFYRRLQGVVG